MIQIIPSVLATSEEQFKKDMYKLSQSESLKNGWVHIDFADNSLVPNKTVGVQTVKDFPADFRKEAHLMVSRPLKWMDKLVDSGFERIIFHLEAEDDVNECIKQIKAKGLEVGLAIKNETPIENLTPYVAKIDIVLLMSIVAGFQGQPFIPETLEKVRKIKSLGWSVKVGVDGAVKDTDAKEIVESGVDFMIVGSYLLKGDAEENLEKLWEVIYER